MPRDPFHLAWRPPRRWHVEAMEAVIPALASGASPLLHVCTGAGKTDLTCHAAWLGAVESGGYHGAVIVVPTQALVEQTYEAMVRRAGGVDGSAALCSVGRWYGNRKEPDRDVVVSCYPSLGSLAEEWAVAERKPHLLIIDEAHGSEAENIRAGIRALGARRMFGLTATPYRGDEAEKLGLFSGVAYEYTYERAVAEGVLVRRTVINWDPDEGVKRMAADDVVLGMLREHAPRREGRVWRTVVDADSIDDAEEYAQRLEAEGIRAASVHSLMRRGDVLDTLARLRDGALDVVVHVNLLSEGVDLPWLRCYALRQRVGSRVRLVQRVGRVLRPDPDDEDKRCGLVLDPWDLCRLVGLDHGAELGESERAAKAAPESKRDWNRLPEPERRERIIEALAASELWVAQLRLAMEEAGLCAAPKFPGGAWRRKEASPRQRETLGKMRRFAQYLPTDATRALLRAIVDASGLTAGAASDAIDVLMGLAHGTREARRASRYQAVPVDVDAPEGAQRVLEWGAKDAVSAGT